MSLGNISKDSARYKEKIKKHIRDKDNLGKYITRDELIAKKGNDIIRIPVPIIHIPRFRYGRVGGVGQGDGEIGDIIDLDSNRDSDPEAGDGPDQGELMDLEMRMSEFEDLVFEELGLPYLEPKGKRNLSAEKPIYNTIGRQGVQKNFKRTYKEALKRTISAGGYQPGDAVIPIKRDFRYRVPSQLPKEESSAVIFYMMDVSGSMDSEKRHLCRLTNSWVERAIKRYYRNVEQKYIVHTTAAHEVDSSVFYGTRLGGGTQASTVFEKAVEIIAEDYPVQDWNIYCFYYSDGDNFESDIDKALAILGNNLLPNVNMFCYGECNGENKKLFLDDIAQRFKLDKKEGNNEVKKKIRTATLVNQDSVLETVKVFLNKNQVPFYQAA